MKAWNAINPGDDASGQKPMNEELKVYLDEKFAYLDDKFAYLDTKFAYLDTKFAAVDRQFAAVDRQFAEVNRQFAEVNRQFAEVNDRFAAVDRQFAAAAEALHDTETRLLSEFWKWGRTAEIRLRRLEGEESTMVERLAAMEERVFTLERKIAGSKE